MSGTIPSILVLPRWPHPHTGAGQRSLLLLEALGRSGPVHVVLMNGRRGTSPEVPGAASVHVMPSELVNPTDRLGLAMVGLRRTLTPGRAYRPDPAVRDDLTALIRKTGARLVCFRYMQTFAAAGLLPAPGPDGLRILVDVDDRDDQKYTSRLTRQLGLRLTGTAPVRNRLTALRGLMVARLSRASVVWFAAESDILSLDGPDIRIWPNVPFVEVPTTLDGSAFPPASGGRSILFVGTHGHLPNVEGVVWFVRHCFPAIRAAHPDAVVRIVGRGPWSTIVPRLGNAPGVVLQGEVGDLSREYAAARLAICPVREGGGSKIKVLEAAAHGRPVVLTPHSLRGFDDGAADLMIAADDPGAFARACLHLLEDPAEADRRGHALRRWQEAGYSRAGVLDRLSGHIDAVLGRSSSRDC